MSAPATQSVDSRERTSFLVNGWTLSPTYLRPVDVTVKEVNHIMRFAIDIAKDFILLSCRLPMEQLCVLQLETALTRLSPHGLH